MVRILRNTRQHGRKPVTEEPEEVPVSTSVQEIVSSNPGYFVRNGTILIFFILCVLVTGLGFIHYPDILEGNATITTNPLPIRLRSANSGRITELFVNDGAAVVKDAAIAELQNNTGYHTILLISGIADRVTAYLHDNDDADLGTLLRQPLSSVGDAQPYYNQLLQSISAYVLLKEEFIYGRRIAGLRQQTDRYNAVAAISGEESRLGAEELKHANERFDANEQLYKDKVISRQEYYEEAAKLRQKQLNEQSGHKNSLENSIRAGENSKQLADVQYEKVEKENSLRLGIEETLRNLQNYVRTWKLQYLLLAPFDGTVHYLRPLQVNEPVSVAEELVAVIPASYHYVARVSLPANGSGKVKVGQEAHLLLSQFPYEEFGYLKGSVGSMSLLPQAPPLAVGSVTSLNPPEYRVDILLPDSLVTTYHQRITFSPEMAARARIITKDRSLLQRLVSGVAGIRR